MVEIRNRLSGVAGDLERLLERLATLQERSSAGSEILDRLKTARHDPTVVREIGRLARRGAFDLPPLSGEPAALEAIGTSVRSQLDRSARQREDVERSISQSQVALQNILAADTAEPSLPPGAPPLGALRLDPRNILHLLGPA